MKCPKCESTQQQVKYGLNKSGSQKYRCNECLAVYTPKPNLNGYAKEIRLLALRMYVEGNSYGAIGRILKVNPQSVANWVKAYTAKLPAAPVPEKPRTVELDELYTYIGKKKTKSMF
jgi:transposase-like protein